MPVWTAWSSRWTARWPGPSWPSPTCSATRTFAAYAARTAAGITRARVSEPILPALVAALWRSREGAEPRALAVVVADDDAARALAESAAVFLPPETAAFLPSRGVGWGSGLDPAPHLVGERHRGLHALARGGLVAVSADALIERIEPPGRRPAPVGLRLGEELPFDDLVARAGRRRATSGPAPSRSAASSRCAAAWWTSSRRPAASRCGWSSSATTSSGSRPSPSSPSARCATSPSVLIHPAAEYTGSDPEYSGVGAGGRRPARTCPRGLCRSRPSWRRPPRSSPGTRPSSPRASRAPTPRPPSACATPRCAPAATSPPRPSPT